VFLILRQIFAPELRDEGMLEVAICASHVSNFVESQLRYQPVLQGIGGVFDSDFTLSRTGEDDFNPQLLAGPLHLGEVAAFMAIEDSGTIDIQGFKYTIFLND